MAAYHCLLTAGSARMTNWNISMAISNGCACWLDLVRLYPLMFCIFRFPTQEFGVNYESQPLQKHEITAMASDPLIIQRIIKSYELMLDFYGMRLVNYETGLVDRCLPLGNHKSRYRNLVRKSHSKTGVESHGMN